eukprot:3130155-Amphidinium_carterae.1
MHCWNFVMCGRCRRRKWQWHSKSLVSMTLLPINLFALKIVLCGYLITAKQRAHNGIGGGPPPHPFCSQRNGI